jgi:hypothetical protein
MTMTEIPHRNPSTAARTPAGSRIAGRVRTRQELEQKARAEYGALPRLILTLDQARRLWNAPVSCCHDVLEALVDEGLIARTTSGAYVRADALRTIEQTEAATALAAAS